MSAMDADLFRMALAYVQRQCSYMDVVPTMSAQRKAARKVYRALKELADARAAIAARKGQG